MSDARTDFEHEISKSYDLSTIDFDCDFNCYFFKNNKGKAQKINHLWESWQACQSLNNKRIAQLESQRDRLLDALKECEDAMTDVGLSDLTRKQTVIKFDKAAKKADTLIAEIEASKISLTSDIKSGTEGQP